MGFPNVDKILVKLFLDTLTAAQDDVADVIDDVFEYDEPEDQAQVSAYLTRLTITGDTQKKARQASDRFLYVIPSFPLADVPFPQIGVFLGNENGNGQFLGDVSGRPVEPVLDETDTVVAYKNVMTEIATVDWQADIVATTKDEVIWLSRLCQWAILTNLDVLDSKGITTVTMTLQDVRVAEVVQPQGMFIRSIKIAARQQNTWKKKRPKGPSVYPGVNTATSR